MLNKTKIFFGIHHESMYLQTMYSKELLKGTLSAIILKLLAENQKMYGYQIAQKVKELSDSKILIKEGSLYPRRYYKLTSEGSLVKSEKVAEIEDFISTIKNILSFKPIAQIT